MKRIRTYRESGGAWEPVAWLLWDHDAQRLRVWRDEPKLTPDEFTALHYAMTDGLPFGWLTETAGFTVQHDPPPPAIPTTRQRLGIPADADLTADGIDDAARAKRRAVDADADALRKLLPTPPAKELRENHDLDAVFFA